MDESTQTQRNRLYDEYVELRAQQQKLIADLLVELPKVDNLDEAYIHQARDAQFHTETPFLMVFVGPFSSGKSSVINALLGDEVLRVGPTPTTDRITILRYGEEPQQITSGDETVTLFHPSPLLQKVSFVDTPGLESVFQEHEAITRRFLHRSDLVFLVMLATQAMTARNVEYLKTLEQYGKKVIILVNQADLLTVEERQTVKEYVLAQSREHLGVTPEVWMVSAKEGKAAWNGDGTRDASRWHDSGLEQVENYILRRLSDAERLRQKLQTPLQILQTVTASALDAVKSNQVILDRYQSINDNIEAQIAAQKSEQEKIVREVNAEIAANFKKAAEQGSAAIRDVFRFNRALLSVGRGVLELVGLTRIFGRVRSVSFVRQAFDRFQALAPIDELPTVVDRLAPRLEGKDMQAVDDLVQYARREADNLPEHLRAKMVGQITAPVSYDRSALLSLREKLEPLEQEARTIEVETLGQIVRNTLLYVATYEILLLIFGVALIRAWSAVGQDQPFLPYMLLALLIGLGLAGLLFLPLRGRMIACNYKARLMKLQARYIEAVTEAADKQMAYGVQMRRDAVLPLTRLLTAQTQIHTEQLQKLQEARQKLADMEREISKLGKRSLLGLRG